MHAIEGGQVRELLILNTAELGRKLHENTIIDSTLKINIWVKWVGFDQAFIRHSLLSKNKYCHCVSGIVSDSM